MQTGVVSLLTSSSSSLDFAATLCSQASSWMPPKLVRTSVSMIGFGFTIYNFYRGFLEDLASGRQDAARNLGLALVAAGTLAMIVAIWNYWSINNALLEMEGALQIPASFKRRWIYAYTLAGILMLIGLVTLLFMLRVI